eukprot:10470885-Heterocapsa_arctica.AAC.1
MLTCVDMFEGDWSKIMRLAVLSAPLARFRGGWVRARPRSRPCPSAAPVAGRCYSKRIIHIA